MNFTQNDKINQVQENTVIIGIDIASQLHYARAFDWRGRELGKVISFENRLEGFTKLDLWIQTLQKEHGKLMILKKVPLPEEIVEMGIEKINQLWRERMEC